MASKPAIPVEGTPTVQPRERQNNTDMDQTALLAAIQEQLSGLEGGTLSSQDIKGAQEALRNNKKVQEDIIAELVKIRADLGKKPSMTDLEAREKLLMEQIASAVKEERIKGQVDVSSMLESQRQALEGRAVFHTDRVIDEVGHLRDSVGEPKKKAVTKAPIKFGWEPDHWAARWGIRVAVAAAIGFLIYKFVYRKFWPKVPKGGMNITLPAGSAELSI